jgi:hypothetical protein
VSLDASPNPALVGQKVVHTVQVSAVGGLDVWVSATGFKRPGLGTLPPGSWLKECCPAETNGSAAWHFRSTQVVLPGSYRFGAKSKAVGTFPSTARLGTAEAVVWVRIV